MFSKQLIEYTESTFKESKIEILTKTMVKEVRCLTICQGVPFGADMTWKVKDKSVVLQMPDKQIVEVPCGMVVWAAVSVIVAWRCPSFRFLSSDGTALSPGK